jgi:uncharacterized cupredoxin-like copper-binding protein
MATKSTVFVGAMIVAASAAWAHENRPGEENLAGRPGDPSSVVRTVRLQASEIKFNVKQLSFKTGETVKFVLVNKGEQDHELTIGDTAFQLDHRKDMQEMATMPNGAMNGMEGHHHDGSAISVKPGETKELVWQFTKPGSFEFACNIPGHAEAGMAGTITVR